MLPLEPTGVQASHTACMISSIPQFAHFLWTSYRFARIHSLQRTSLCHPWRNSSRRRQLNGTIQARVISSSRRPRYAYLATNRPTTICLFYKLSITNVLPKNHQANTIGLALYDNPVGQLAWIGEKFVNCELIDSYIGSLFSPRVKCS